MLPIRNINRNLQKVLSQPHYAWSAAKQRFKSYLSYRFLNGRSAYPETLSFFLNYRCNLRCPMCGQWGDSGAFKDFSSEKLKQNLSLDAVKAVLEDVKDFKPTITLFGGEPMMHKDWIEILRCVKTAGLRCNIVTNGTLLSKYAEPIVDLQLDEIIFSLDGPREIHDAMRGKPGTFDRALEGFTRLNALKREQKRKRPLVNFNCTIYENNYRQLEALLEIAERVQACSITFHHLLFINSEINNRHNGIFEAHFGHRCHEWSGFVRENLPAIDPEVLIEKVKAISRTKSRIRVNFYPNFTPAEIRSYYTSFEFTSTSYRNRCLSLWMAAYIFPNGDVRPYHSMDYTLGNVQQSTFKEIWNNEKFQVYRRFIKRNRKFPVCAKGCTEFYRY
ncbi:MAG: radical SAM protein [bacterium]